MEYALCAIPGHPSGTAPHICCPAQACTKLSRRQALLKPPATPKSPARDYSQGYRTSPCGLTDNFPTELNSLTKLWQKAAALSILPSQTGEVNQTTGTTALRTSKEVKETQFGENTPCFYVSHSVDPGQLHIIAFSWDSAAYLWDVALWDARDE